MELLEPVVEAIAGNVEGFSTLVALVIGAKWLRRGAQFGEYLELLAYFMGFLVLLTVAGVADLNLARAGDLVGAAGRLLGDLVGAFL